MNVAALYSLSLLKDTWNSFIFSQECYRKYPYSNVWVKVLQSADFPLNDLQRLVLETTVKRKYGKQHIGDTTAYICMTPHELPPVSPWSTILWYSQFVLGISGFSCGAFDLTSHSSDLSESSRSSWAQLHSTELSSPDVYIPPPLPKSLLPDLEWENKHTPWNTVQFPGFYMHTNKTSLKPAARLWEFTV